MYVIASLLFNNNLGWGGGLETQLHSNGLLKGNVDNKLNAITNRPEHTNIRSKINGSFSPDIFWLFFIMNFIGRQSYSFQTQHTQILYMKVLI